MEFMIFGLLAGICCGLVPMTMAINKNKTNLAMTALFVCAFCGTILGLLLAVPVAFIFSYNILKDKE
jgi:ABC-type phosphate/phosphonate transport system permease subunit